MSKCVIRNLAIIFIMIVAPTAALSAAEYNYPNIDICQAEVDRFYGKNTDLQIISKRRMAQGMQVKLSAQMDQDNSEFLICWIPNGQSPDQADTLAARIEPIPLIQ